MGMMELIHKNSILFHRRSQDCDLADSPLTSQNHCHCQDCLVFPLLSMRQQQLMLIDDSGLCIRACLVSSFHVHTSRLNTQKRCTYSIFKVWGLRPSCKHDGVLSHSPSGYSLGGLCVLFQSSKLLGLGSPLSAYHSATLMATWTLKFYSRLLRGAGGGAEEIFLASLCSAGGHFAILLLHKRLLQVPV